MAAGMLFVMLRPYPFSNPLPNKTKRKVQVYNVKNLYPHAANAVKPRMPQCQLQEPTLAAVLTTAAQLLEYLVREVISN